MADECSLCDTRRPEGGTNHLILGSKWIEFCAPCAERTRLHNADTGETVTLAILFARVQDEPKVSGKSGSLVAVESGSYADYDDLPEIIALHERDCARDEDEAAALNPDPHDLIPSRIRMAVTRCGSRDKRKVRMDAAARKDQRRGKRQANRRERHLWRKVERGHVHPALLARMGVPGWTGHDVS